MAATKRLDPNAKAFHRLPRGFRYAIVADFGNNDGVFVSDVYGHFNPFYSSPLRNICSQLPPTHEGKFPAGCMSPVHRRNKNRRRTATERKRREEQQAKDHASHAEETVALKKLTEQKAALAAKTAEDHRQMQISRSAAEKKERIAKKAEAHQIAQMSRSAVEKEVKAALAADKAEANRQAQASRSATAKLQKSAGSSPKEKIEKDALQKTNANVVQMPHSSTSPAVVPTTSSSSSPPRTVIENVPAELTRYGVL